MSQSCEGHGLAHGRVPWPCGILGMLMSETECPCFYTRARTQACLGRVKHTGQGHGCVLGCVKTPVGVHLELIPMSGGHGHVPVLLRPCEPYGPSTRPC